MLHNSPTKPGVRQSRHRLTALITASRNLKKLDCAASTAGFATEGRSARRKVARDRRD